MILLMYFLAGVNKMLNYTNTVLGFKNMFFLKALPRLFYDLAIVGVIILEIIAPAIILFSVQSNSMKNYAYYSSISLAIFTILATLIYHSPPIGSQYYAFMKNLTATGSLFLLAEYLKLTSN